MKIFKLSIPSLKKRIAPPELIQQLIDLKLIAPISENDSEFTEQIPLSESPTTSLEVKVQQKKHYR